MRINIHFHDDDELFSWKKIFIVVKINIYSHESFLVGYEKVLPPFGELHFKTDNRGLFEYSLASFSQFGLVLKQVWLDLHQVEFPGNVMTEYEEKFSAKGHPIYRVEVIFPQDRKAFKQPE